MTWINLKTFLGQGCFTCLLDTGLESLSATFDEHTLNEALSTRCKAVEQTHTSSGNGCCFKIVRVDFSTAIVFGSFLSDRAEDLHSLKGGRTSNTTSDTADNSTTWASQATEGSTTSSADCSGRDGATKLAYLFTYGFWEIAPCVGTIFVGVHKTLTTRLIVFGQRGQSLEELASLFCPEDLRSRTCSFEDRVYVGLKCIR